MNIAAGQIKSHGFDSSRLNDFLYINHNRLVCRLIRFIAIRCVDESDAKLLRCAVAAMNMSENVEFRAYFFNPFSQFFATRIFNKILFRYFV